MSRMVASHNPYTNHGSHDSEHSLDLTQDPPAETIGQLARAIRTAQADAFVQEGPRGLEVHVLEGTEEPYRMMAEAMGDGAVVLDRDGFIVYANPAMERILGVAVDVLRGDHLDARMAQRSQHRFREAFRSLTELGGTLDVEFRRQAELLPVHLTARPFHTVDFDGLICVATDYSEVQRMTDQLESRVVDRTAELSRTNQALGRMNDAMGDVMSTVNHEFRNALVGIQGFAELLRDSDLSTDEVKGFAADIYNDTARLVRMITEMLEVDRLESGRVRLFLTTVDVNAKVSEAVKRARVLGSKCVIETRLDSKLEPITADPDRLMQVISNLLGNAVKYSPEGGLVRVTTQMETDQVHVSVQDHGIGIAPADLDRLFKRYERVEGNRGHNMTGTGLGLVITRQIVKLHGGRIWVDSKLGQGSTFHFTVPTTIPSPRTTS